MKIKFDADDNLPLNKTIEIHNMTIALRAITYENKNIIHKFSRMNACIYYEYYKNVILIELTFLKELMLIKQANQKSAMFVTIGIFR